MLRSFLLSFLPPSLPSFLPSFLPSVRPSVCPSVRPSVRPSILACLLPNGTSTSCMPFSGITTFYINCNRPSGNTTQRRQLESTSSTLGCSISMTTALMSRTIERTPFMWEKGRGDKCCPGPETCLPCARPVLRASVSEWQIRP